MKSVALIISPNYKDYGKKYLHDCIESVRKQDYQGEIKVFMTDNETSLESFEFLRRIVPEAEISLNKANDGFAKGNNDSIRLALQQGFYYIFCINMDTILDKSCVRKLVEEMEKDTEIGLAQSRLMLHPEINLVNSLGNDTHFLGFGYCRGYREELNNIQAKIDVVFEIFYPSGAAVIFCSNLLKKIGLFDEEYWMYNEDQEIGWRTWLAGSKCVLIPESVVFHKYEFSKSIKKFYWMDRNRILAILECYHFLTLLLILPAFIVMEIGLILFSLKSGWFKDKMRVWLYFLNIKNWRYIIKARKRNQSLRKVKDKTIIKLITGKIWYQEVDDWKLRFINPVFSAYWWFVKKIVIW